MESCSSLNSNRFYSTLQRLRYFNSLSNTKTFFQSVHRRKQRVIPLTRDIQKAMMDFNGSRSSTNVSERPCCVTTSMSLARSEVINNMQALSNSDQFMRNEHIDNIIEKRLKEVTILQDSGAKIQHITGDTNEEFEIIVEEVTEGRDKNNLIAENIKILEDRVTTLETRLSYMLQNIPKLRHIQAKRFKIKVNAIKKRIKTLYKIDTQKDIEKSKDKSASKEVVTNKVMPLNVYDDMFYTTRECTLNLLNYKKSLESIELNQKPKWNPNVRPVNIALAPLGFKKCSMFLDTNDVSVG